MCSASYRGVGLGDLLLHHLVPGDEDAVQPDAGGGRGTTNMRLTHITNSRPATRPAEINHFSPLMIHSSPSRSARVLNRFLHVWSLTAVAAGQPGHYEELAAARAGTAVTVPASDAIPDWTERAAAARSRR
jgi:hypothetical protein